jgi:O-antigen ligase
MSAVIGVWRSGVNFDTLEGVKSIFATLCGVLLVRHFSLDIHFYLRSYAYIFGSIVIFSVIQISIAVNWETQNSFFTVGAENRWWDLNSAWGPFALSGKNVFGAILVISFSLLAPITFMTKIFNNFDRFFISIILILDIYLILLSRSRTSIILVLLNLIILLLFFTAYSKNPIPLTFSLLFIPLLGGFFFYRNTSWILSNESSIARGNSLNAALMAPDSNFLFGTGYNSIFQLTASTFGNSLAQAGTRGVNVDNYFVRRSLEGGLVGLVSLLGIIASLFYLFIIRERFGKQGRIWGISSVLLAIDITVSSTTGDFLSFQLINCFFFLMIALIAGGLRSSAP